ncbi:MAG: CASTOR/POLLUX-related putative ion channel, partial [bacterium]
TRSGSTTSIRNLKGVGIQHAHSVVVLNNAKSSDSNEAKELADARVIKTIMAVVAAKGEEAPPVIAEIYIERYRLLAETIVQGKVTTMNEADILARMLVQTSRNKGLAMVYADLVGFEGNEFYFFKPDEGWNGVNFGDLQFQFMESVPLGLRLPSGEILLNPPRERILQEEDEIVVLAEDDSTINFSSERVFEPKVHPYSDLRKVIPEEHHLIVGWNNKAPIVLSEYAGYMAPGSSVDLLIEANADPEIRKDFEKIARQFPDVQMNFNEIDFQSEEELDNLGLPGYTTVSILAGSGDEAEEIDARTIMRLLQIRNIFKEAEKSSGVPTETKLISEIVNSENTELIVQVGVKDFLISNQFVSRIFAQVALEKDVMHVYDDLFQKEGSEIYIKPIDLYFEQPEGLNVTFADCVLAAQQRDEVCFGIKLGRQETEIEQNFGIYIIPPKDRHYTLRDDDALIVLAEEED